MKIKRDLLIILILFFIGICLGHMQSYAAYYHYSSDGVWCPGQMAVEYDYDDVSKWEYNGQSFQAANAWAANRLEGDDPDVPISYGIPNCICMQTSAEDGITRESTSPLVVAVFTIDCDGNCYVTCKKNNTTSEKELNISDEAKNYTRALAYICYALENDPDNRFDYINSKNGAGKNEWRSFYPGAYHYVYDPQGYCYSGFQVLWNNFYNSSKEELKNNVGNVKYIPHSNNHGSTVSNRDKYYEDAMSYGGQGYISSNYTYEAKIFISCNGNSQGRAIVFGNRSKKVDYTKIGITKYISSTTNDSSLNRSGLINSEKKENPVQVGPGNTITFKIKLTNSGTAKANNIELIDNFNINYFTCISSSDTWFDSGGGKYKYVKSLSLDANETKTITIKFEVNKDAKISSSIVRKNTASVTFNGTTKNSADYVIIDPEVTIKKYITNVDYPNGKSLTISGRRTYGEDDKRGDPINVVPETEITYTIAVKAKYDCTLKIKDTYNSNLTLVSSKSSWTYSGTEKKTYTIKLKMGDVKSSKTTVRSNKAYIDGNGSTYYSKDYVKCDYTDTTDQDSATLKIVNYISKIEKPDGTIQDFENSRSDYSNEMAGAYPVVVEKGDKVTYTIEVTNNYEENFENEKSYRNNPDTATIRNVYVYVSWQDGLQYSLSSDNTKSIIVGKKDEEIKPKDTASSTITLTVTKSDMYLYTVEEWIEFNEGEFYQETIYYRTFTAPNGKDYTYEYKDRKDKYTTFDDTTSSVTATYTEDYIELDDVEIAGNVWLDSNENGLMDSQENGFQDVYVSLYQYKENDNSYEKLCEKKKVNENGYFTFGRVTKGTTKYEDSLYPNATRKYAKGSGYYKYIIKFEYNGVLYEPTEYVDESCVTDSGYIDPYKDWDSRSHASENESDRIAFNNSFETVAYDKAYSGTSSSSNKKTLSYTKDGHISTIDWDASTTMEASSFAVFPIDNQEADTTMTRRIDYVDYLKHMNLGLVERGQADLSASKDLVEVYTTVNGSETTYIYNGSSEGELEEYYRSDPYALKIYNEDYSYRTSNYDSTILEILGYTNENADQNDLQVRLTYKIMLSNDSVKEYYGVIREVIDIYSDSLELDRVYDSTGEWNQPHNTSSYNEDSYNYDGYTTCFITGSELETVLAPGDTKEFYIDYSLKKNNGSIILDEERNIAQIGAFSIYDNENKTTPSGVVDGDANPGNAIIYGSLDDYESYEDNIYSTSIDISLRGDPGEEPPGGEPEPEDDPPPTPDPKQDPGDEYRVISGNVWEDLIITDETNEGEPVGNGYKDEDEEWAENITVYLYESITGNDGNEYLVYSGISTSTDSDGNYYLYDKDKLHAGNYKVRFIYGNDKDTLLTDDGGDTIKFSGQDYKSTLYTDVKSDVDEDQLIYGSEFENYYKNNGEYIYSEAKDNELRRLEVIDYSTTMTYELDKILKDKNSSDLVKNTYMFADTRTFIVTIEDYNNYSNPPENFIYTNTEIFKNSYMENKIGNINFGLITRPQTKLVGTKDISRITAITSDGNPLVDLNFDIYYFTDDEGDFSHVTQLNEEESQGYKNVQILDRSRKSTSNQGFRYINIDSILMQGMTIIVEYQVGIGNTSDIDFENENLINIVENYDLGNVVDSFKGYLGELVSMGHTYGEDASNINKTLVYSSISNINLDNVIETFESEYPEYKIDGSYSSGYFLGDTYYTGEYDAEHEKVVPTRIDQIIDYVDTDLVLDLSENTNEKGEGKFINYTADQIYNYGLLADINEETSNEEITDGVSSYIVEDSEGTVIKNNLAFNVESEEVNPTLYKFLPPLSTVDEETTTPATYIDVDELNSSNTTEKYVTYEDKDGNEQQVNAYNYDDLYVITLNASRTLSSEQDADGLSIDNVSEIVKVTNTAGRKVYVLNQGTTNDVGHIGNSFKDVRRMYSDEEDDEDITIKTVVGETDTDYTEFITFSPPTGLGLEKENEHRIVGAIFGITITLCVVAGGLTVIIYKSTRKKFYR